ncbi:MAG: hypothetical protein FWE72_03695 [Spirochaetaceae bacterium]|nr:hypothetical protein [Spirochaetaceae bacterium]MCL2705294.1 hypothetical protein [Spirochaetaceae bacterium]
MNIDEGLKQFLESVKQGIKKMKEYNSKELILLHHNDSDGLSSGALLLKAFQRAGYNVKRFSLEKPYPAVLKKLFGENSGKIIIFADFAGKIAPMISSLNKGKNIVIILDHHEAEESKDISVINLDPDLFGLKGDRDISASVVCYCFVKELDNANKDIAHIAAFGGIADFYHINNQLYSYNKLCFEEAVEVGLMRNEDKNGKEQFFIMLGKKEVNVVDFYPMIDIAGGVGFYDGGPELAISIFLEGLTEEKLLKLRELKKTKDHIFNKELENLKKNSLNDTGNIQWFDVENRFSPMGVKMIGVFLEEIADMDFIDPDKYLSGFMFVPDNVPGFGNIKMGQTKVSMRGSHNLSSKIINKKMPGMNEFLPEATNNLGGFADASHRITAATTINIGKEKELMEEAQKILESKMKKMED